MVYFLKMYQWVILMHLINSLFHIDPLKVAVIRVVVIMQYCDYSILHCLPKSSGSLLKKWIPHNTTLFQNQNFLTLDRYFSEFF